MSLPERAVGWEGLAELADGSGRLAVLGATTAVQQVNVLQPALRAWCCLEKTAVKKYGVPGIAGFPFIGSSFCCHLPHGKCLVSPSP